MPSACASRLFKPRDKAASSANSCALITAATPATIGLFSGTSNTVAISEGLSIISPFAFTSTNLPLIFPARFNATGCATGADVGFLVALGAGDQESASAGMFCINLCLT